MVLFKYIEDGDTLQTFYTTESSKRYDIIFRWKFEVREHGSHAVWKSQDQDHTPYRMSDLSR